MKRDFLKILKGAVITKDRNGCFLNKYVRDCSHQKIDSDLFKILEYYKIIEHESGNWETHESHYQLSERFIIIRDDIRCVNFTKIQEVIYEHNQHYYYYRFNAAFESIKKDVVRKTKLNKLNGKF